MGPVARLVNRLGGNFRWQHLPVPFEVYADGIDLVIFEEFGSGAAALHLQEEVDRNELMRDEEYRRQFRKDYENKFGLAGVAPRLLRRRHRRLPGRVGGRQVVRPGRRERAGCTPSMRSSIWCSSTARRCAGARRSPTTGPRCSRRWRANPGIQMGFSDAGAHLRNMAFYNFGLRLLRHVRDAERAGRPFMTVEQAVHRLTGELADWYRLDAGHLRVGDRADLVVLDPDPARRRRSRRTPRSRSSSTADCPGWSTATTRPSPPCSSVAVRCSWTASATELVGRRANRAVPARRTETPAPAGRRSA